MQSARTRHCKEISFSQYRVTWNDTAWSQYLQQSKDNIFDIALLDSNLKSTYVNTKNLFLSDFPDFKEKIQYFFALWKIIVDTWETNF